MSVTTKGRTTGSVSIEGARAAKDLFQGLAEDWRRITRSKAAQWHMDVRLGMDSEPVLCGANAYEVVARVTWDGYVPSPGGAVLLSALLRLAGAEVWARGLLQALLPRIRAENVYTAAYGYGVAECWQRPIDTAADLVAECFAAIRRHAGEDRDHVERLIVGEAARRLRTARQAQRRYQSRTATLMPCHASRATAELAASRSSAEWLASAILSALGRNALSAEDARLLYAVRVMGLPASEAGRSTGMAPKAVYHALVRAERALLAGAVVAA